MSKDIYKELFKNCCVFSETIFKNLWEEGNSGYVRPQISNNYIEINRGIYLLLYSVIVPFK